jgi:hypothetical protein
LALAPRRLPSRDGYAFLSAITFRLQASFFFGVYFSALYIRSGSLVPGIFLHTIFNFVSNLDAFAPGAQPRSEVVRNTTPEAAVAGVLITLPLLLAGLFYLRRSKVQLPVIEEPGA